MLSDLNPAQRLIYTETAKRQGQVFADKLLASWSVEKRPTPSPVEVESCSLSDALEAHLSHLRATELLEPYREALGAAYGTLHALARWSTEQATDDDPAPHLMTTYWTLEEITGLSERTLRRHLIEDGHPWSEIVCHLIDVRRNYGMMPQGEEEKSVITNMVIRFFPKGRLSPQAKVKRWEKRNLIEEADNGRTRATRPRAYEEKQRYKRYESLMSASSSVREQVEEHNWFMVKLGQTVPIGANKKDFGRLYADIPTKHLLDALRADLRLSEENARHRGANIKRARSLWVENAGQLLAKRHGEHCPRPEHDHPKHVTYADGFTKLWQKAFWTALKAQLYGGTEEGWRLLGRMILLAEEVEGEGVRKPTAYAWSKVKREGFSELMRDYSAGAAGDPMRA